MTARFLFAALAASLILAGGAQAQKKSIADPKEAQADADFAIQGEYEGTLTHDGTEEKLGAQVVALGEGKFDVILMRGGLPGAGWDAETKLTFQGETKDKSCAVTGTGPDGSPVTGSIADGKLNLKAGDGVATASLKRVERKSDTLGKKAPDGAIILFDGSGADEWQGGQTIELSDGTFLKVGTKSKAAFGDCTIHLEFRLAFMPGARGQARSNSGVYIQDRYECQVLDSFGLEGLDNECGGFYKQNRPSVNMCLPPMQWQTYDIELTGAKFGDDGNKTANARATVYHNGVKIHDDIEFPEATAGAGLKETSKPGPIQLQDHGDPVVYRNIWVQPKE